MIKNILLGVVFLVGSFFATNAGASTREEIVQSTYKLYYEGQPICTAVAVSPKQWLTAAHCTGGTGRLNIRVVHENDKWEVTGEQIEYLKPIRILKRRDVALLEVADTNRWTNPVFVDIADPMEVKSSLTLGEEVMAVGYPMTFEVTITKGQFSGFVKSPTAAWDSPLLKATVPVTGGSSGGGLYWATFKDFRITYELIGLTSAGFPHVSFMNYFSSPDAIAEVTKNLLNTQGTSNGNEEVKNNSLPSDANNIDLR